MIITIRAIFRSIFFNNNRITIDPAWYNIKTIRRQYAERIDKYFTMFGYAQNIVAVPNIHARQYFTYVKTTGSCVSGSIPQDDRETIDTIFDRGIRFWTNYDYFENYTVNNAII